MKVVLAVVMAFASFSVANAQNQQQALAKINTATADSVLAGNALTKACSYNSTVIANYYNAVDRLDSFTNMPAATLQVIQNLEFQALLDLGAATSQYNKASASWSLGTTVLSDAEASYIFKDYPSAWNEGIQADNDFQSVLVTAPDSSSLASDAQVLVAMMETMMDFYVGNGGK